MAEQNSKQLKCLSTKTAKTIISGLILHFQELYTFSVNHCESQKEPREIKKRVEAFLSPYTDTLGLPNNTSLAESEEEYNFGRTWDNPDDMNDVDNNQTGRPKQEEQWQEGLYDIMNEALDPMCLYPPPGIDIENPVYLSPEINDYNEVLANQILANQISYKPEHHQYVQRNRIKKQNTTNQPTLKAVTSMAQQLHLAAQVLEYIDKQQAADMFTGIHKTHEDFGSQRKTNFQRSRRPMAGSKGRNMKKSQVPKRSNSQPVFQNRKNLQQNIPVTKKLSYTTRIRGDDSNQVFTPDQYQRYMQEYVNEFDSSLSSKRMLNKVSPYTGPMSPYANELLRLAHLNLAGNHSNRPHPHNPAPPRSRKPTHSGIRSRNYRRVTLNQGATPVTPWVNK